MSNEGVCGHSSPVGQREYVVFCVGDSILRNAQFWAWVQTTSLGCKQVKGMYKGIPETSYVMNRENFETGVLPHGWVDEQESVLFLGPQDARGRRPATLRWMYGFKSPEYLGLFQSVSRSKALAQDAWTFDPTTGQYYIAIREKNDVRRVDWDVSRSMFLSRDFYGAVPVDAPRAGANTDLTV